MKQSAPSNRAWHGTPGLGVVPCIFTPAAGLFAYLTGLSVIAVAILRESELSVRVGGASLFTSLLLFGGNAANVFAHFRRPQIKPLVTSTPAATKPTTRFVLHLQHRNGQSQ